jgi:hypothetical protein
MATDLRMQKVHIADDKDRREDEDEVHSVSNEHNSIRSECETEYGNSEDNETVTDDRNCEQYDTSESK